MSLREVLATLAEVQSRVAIEEPVPARIARVYPYLPPGQNSIDTPCVINQWRYVGQTLRANGQREQRYVLRSQVFVASHGPNFDLYSEIATALHDAMVEAIAANLTLNGLVSQLAIRGEEGDYQPVIFERNGLGYIGLGYLIDVTVHDLVTVGP